MFARFLFALIGLLGFAIWLASLILFVAGRNQKSRAMMWLSGIPLTISSVSGVVAVSWIVYVTIVPIRPIDAYQRAFGGAPTSAVIGLQSRSNSSNFGTSRQSYFKFKAAPTTIKNITVKGWEVGDANDWANSGGETDLKEEAPSWWRPKKTERTQVFYASKRLGNFSFIEKETLIYNAATGEAFYLYSGSD